MAMQNIKKNPILQRLLSKLTKAPSGKKFALAVSGGVDSVSLLLLIREWSKMKHKEICVFHVNHSMRSTSGEDAEWVKELCEEKGIEFYSRTATKEDLSKNRELGAEGWARNFRYSSFASMLQESGAEVIVTGHNSGDQAETVLMRMLRGCSWQGIGGIRSRAKLNFQNTDLKMWRPLLNISRLELTKFLESLNQSWREDETNQTNIYLRNKVRHRLIPLFEDIYKGSIEHIVALGTDAVQLQKDLNKRAYRFIKKYKDFEKNQLLVSLKPEGSLRKEVIRIWLEGSGLSRSISRRLIERIDELWLNKNNGRSVKHRSFEVLRHKKHLWLRVFGS